MYCSVAVLKVTMEIEYDPPSDFSLPSPPYYRPASSVVIICSTIGAVGSVYYEWSSTFGQSFVNDSTTSDRVNISILQPHHAGVHTCTAFDDAGNTGNQSTEMRLIGNNSYIATSQ